MNRVRSLFIAGLLFAVAEPSIFAGETFKIDPAHSTISFKVRHLLGTAKGKFTNFEGTVVVDRDQPGQSSVTATIQVASLDTGIAKRDEHLRSDEFFYVQKFPAITFKSRQVKKTSENAGEITGDLTMHGVTRPITLRVQLRNSSGSDLKGPLKWHVVTNPIKRSEFGLAWSKNVEAISMIGDEVSIEMEIETPRAR